MSLWRKEPEQITLTDIESFCTQGQPEGIRLDYKLDIPQKLQKVVAAFANTMGGLVLLGVDMDRQTNQPKLPLAGMEAKPGIEDRIKAMCQDGIYPPVLPRMSLPLALPSQSDRVVMVLRIDQSLEAPHAVDGQVYMRVGGQGRAYSYDPAHIDQIRLLLTRRDEIERRRIDIVEKEIRRGVMQLVETNLSLGEEAGDQPPPAEPVI
jgi:predicted HTH transcriptional regulator